MKIEKLSDNQIKLTLTHADLKERNIDIEELIKPSEKTQELFRDIMEQAFNECGFQFEDASLMVEATPVSVGGLMIIVTKLPSKETNKDKASLIAQNKEIRRYKRKTITHFVPEQKNDDGICIFSFENLDDVSAVSERISEAFTGFSMLYKLNSKFFLLLQSQVSEEKLSSDNMELVLSEYGSKHVSDTLSKYYLLEHGEVIIKNDAIHILATI